MNPLPRVVLGRAGVIATVAVVAFLTSLELGVVPAPVAQRASDVLQFALALSTSAACLLAARRREARGFWAGLGLGCLAWAGGQLFWVLRGVPLSGSDAYVEADVLFTASTGFFLGAFVVRPDRRDTSPLLQAIDVAVVLTAMLYLYYEVAYAHLQLGEAAIYETWSTFLFDFRGLALLPAILWALRYAEPAWRPLYAWLAPAFLLLQLGGGVTNQSFRNDVAGPTTRVSTIWPGRCPSSGSACWRCVSAVRRPPRDWRPCRATGRARAGRR